MPKVRAYGADATLLAARETSYGVLPLADWCSLDFKSTRGAPGGVRCRAGGRLEQGYGGGWILAEQPPSNGILLWA